MRVMIETPWDVCDRRCERCPLASDCRLHERELAARAAAVARGKDPDDLGVIFELVAEEFARAGAMLEEDAAELGVDLDHLEPIEPPEAGALLSAAGMAYATAAHDVAEAIPESALIAEARYAAYLVSAKTARIAFDLPLGDEDREGTVAVLLMIELLLGQATSLLRLALGGVSGFDRVLGAGEEVRTLLAGHLAEVSASDRASVAGLVEEGRAPSPFCVIDGVGLAMSDGPTAA